MKLFIHDFANHHSLSENAFTLDPSMLKYKAVHLFIASYKWDRIDITLDDTIQSEDLRFIHLVSDDIHAYIPKDVSTNVLSCLCSLYPDKAGSLRQAYMCNSGLNRVSTNIEVST